MEQRDRSETEKAVPEGLCILDLGVFQVQEVGSEGLQSDHKLKESEDTEENEASKLVAVQERLKMMHQGKEPGQEVPIQDSLQKSEEKESSLQESRELAEDEVLDQVSDVNMMVQQKDESSFSQEQDSRQIEVDAIHQECDALSEGWLSESYGNTTVQQTTEIPEIILFLSDAEFIESFLEDIAIHQECVGSLENDPLKQKSETNLTVQQKSVLVLIEDPIQIAEQESNDVVQKEFDRSTENDRLLQEIESTPESEEPCLVPLRTQELRDVTSFPLPGRIYHHDTRLMRRQRSHPIPEQTDHPLELFEEEILAGRNRTLGARPTTIPTGMNDYMQRVSERHIPPERRALYEELQARCVKLFYSLLISAIVVVALYFLIDFLEKKYDNKGDSNVTSSLPNF